MKIDYKRAFMSPAISDEVSRRINLALAIVAEKQPGQELSYLDIASGLGGVLTEFIAQIPDTRERGVMVERFVRALREQTGTAHYADPVNLASGFALKH